MNEKTEENVNSVEKYENNLFVDVSKEELLAALKHLSEIQNNRVDDMFI